MLYDFTGEYGRVTCIVCGRRYLDIISEFSNERCCDCATQ